MADSGIYVPVSEIFPGVVADFQTFRQVVSRLSRTDTVSWWARLNLVLSNPKEDRKAAQDWSIGRFFDASQSIAVNAFARKHGGAERVGVLERLR